MSVKSWTGLASLIVAVMMGAAPARAEKDWNKDHPRRAEVNGRLRNQHRRVKQGVKDGTLTKDQAQQINKEDRGIRREERRMAARDGGHITAADQAKLNRQENGVSNQINRDEAANKAAAGGAPIAPAAAPAAPAAPVTPPAPAPAQ